MGKLRRQGQTEGCDQSCGGGKSLEHLRNTSSLSFLRIQEQNLIKWEPVRRPKKWGETHAGGLLGGKWESRKVISKKNLVA